MQTTLGQTTLHPLLVAQETFLLEKAFKWLLLLMELGSYLLLELLLLQIKHGQLLIMMLLIQELEHDGI